jgi:hypothetical protein
LLEGMKMSHVYQPVMIKRLLLGHGMAKVEEIAVKRKDSKELYQIHERP